MLSNIFTFIYLCLTKDDSQSCFWVILNLYAISLKSSLTFCLPCWNLRLNSAKLASINNMVNKEKEKKKKISWKRITERKMHISLILTTLQDGDQREQSWRAQTIRKQSIAVKFFPISKASVGKRCVFFAYLLVEPMGAPNLVGSCTKGKARQIR